VASLTKPAGVSQVWLSYWMALPEADQGAERTRDVSSSPASALSRRRYTVPGEEPKSILRNAPPSSSATIRLWAICDGARPLWTSVPHRLLILVGGILMRPRCVFVVLTGLLLFLVVVHPAGTEESPSEPAVSSALRVPPGHTLLARAEAKGVQI